MENGIKFKSYLPYHQKLMPAVRLKHIAMIEREVKRLEVHLLELEQPFPRLFRLRRKLRQIRRIFR